MKTLLQISVFVASIFFADGSNQIELSTAPFPVKLPKVRNKIWNMDNFFATPPHFDINMKYTWEKRFKVVPDIIQSHVRVTGQNKEKAKRIVLEGYMMKFNTTSIQVKCQGRVLEAKEINLNFNSFYPLVYIVFQNEIEAFSELEIYMEYTMQLDDWSIWHESGDENRILVNHKSGERTNHPIACNFMFPCFGNGVTSTFNLTIIRENDYSSVANGEVVKIKRESQPEGSYSDEYTWLTAVLPEVVGFVIFSNDFQYVESVCGKDNTSIRVYAPKEDINMNVFQYTANVSAEIFTYFEEKTGTFPEVSKFDFFFIPQSHTLIDIRGINVYGYSTNFDSNRNPTGQLELTKAKMINRIIPELTKQGLDPLGKYGGSKYINARFIEYHALAHVCSFNSTLSDLAIYQDLKDIEELNRHTAEDELRFSNKYALLLRYMKSVMYDYELSIFYQQEWLIAPRVTDTFIEKKGMPLISVSIANETHFAFKQEPFHNKELDAEASHEKSELWTLPVTHIQNLQKQNYTILTPDEIVAFTSGNTDEHIFVNPDGTGYHRTLYNDPILFSRIQTQLNRNHESFTPLARARLLSDYFTFAENGYSNYSSALRLTGYLTKETSVVVWTAFLDKFIDVYSKFLNHPKYHIIEFFLMQKVDFHLREMEKLSDLSEELQLLRENLLSVSCRFRSIRDKILDPPYCLFYARELFRLWSSDPNGVSPLDSISPWSLRPELKCAIVASSGMESFQFMFTKFRNSTRTSNTYNDTLRSLGCAQDTDVIQVLLEKTLQHPSDGGFSPLEVYYLLIFMIKSPASNGRPQIITFISKNYKQLVKKVGNNGDGFMVYLVNSLANHVYTLEKRNEVRSHIFTHWV
ncbi:unnamed protein product [Orchesella dallaii]|uniref:ERAP1-like C-terminal domain-containing protein n=1 Tax=Orchesella dallaii TaxID=48710 RepID=A0ABP1S8E4_9HEXA